MKYFCSVNERVGTCYHEFYRGKWDGKTFWKSDSILLHDDTLTELKIYEAFAAAIPDYAPYGVTEVNKAQWDAVLEYPSLSPEAKAALAEAEPWVKETFKSEKVFTILGI